MEKVGEDEEKTIEEARNSVEETSSDKEDERIRDTITKRFDPVDYAEEGSTDPSNSQTVTFEDHDVNDYDMEDEEVLQLFRRNRRNVPQLQEDTPAETEQESAVFHSLNDSSEIPEILEEVRSSSASTEDNEDSSSNSDLDSGLFMYYFDGSLPVSAHAEESETHQDDSLAPKDENQMPLLCPKQPTSWRNCCGLLELIRAADP
ncbi:unnamed protein product [Thlaspi arvense]|uniref:Uncharacterized protein n=1 Tax=Thlaspi arvense TaxID=13288 RepID=A0AAU9S8R7_THLAR|nr:unnamed protein product [Thlaspi arvense]